MAKAKEKEKLNLEDTLKILEKKYGSGTIMSLDDGVLDKSIEAISTGSVGLDLATGIYGFPRGRIVTVVGPYSSGKSTTVYNTLANAQKLGYKVALIDVEYSFDISYATALGMDISSLIFTQPDNAEQALEIFKDLVNTGEIAVIALDSVAALVPLEELEANYTDAKVALQARMLSRAMRTLTPIIGKSNTLAIFTNQIRTNIGVMYGSNKTQPGGEALKFYSSMMVEFSKKDIKDSDGEIVGNITRAKVIKNKCAIPFKVAEFTTVFGQGIDNFLEVLDIGYDHDIIEKSGAWYNYGDIKLGQGKDNALLFLKDNPKIFEEIKAKILS